MTSAASHLAPPSINSLLSESRLGIKRAALVQLPQPEMVPTGVPEIDALAGGIPRGALTEIVGPLSSGRTSLILSLLAQATERGEICAVVDATDALDIQSAQSAGIDLQRLLWVRCKSGNNARTQVENALKATDLFLQSGGFGIVVLDLADVPHAVSRRIPLVSWFRFRRAVENTPTALVAVEREASGKTAASLVLRLSQSEIQWRENKVSHCRVLEHIEVNAEVLRAQFSLRKPSGSIRARYPISAAWSI